MSIELVAMRGGEETASRRRGGAGGNQTDRGRETVAETDAENVMRSLRNKLRDSSTMSGVGKTVSGVKKPKNRILVARMNLLLKKRNPTLNCRGH